MPAAVLIGGLVALALAFAAISATLLVRNLVVSPINGAAAAVAEVAIIGGVLSWALGHLAMLIEVALAPMQSLSLVAQQQAASTWNYIVHETVFPQFWVYFNAANIFSGMLPSIVNTINGLQALSSLVTHSILPTVSATTSTVSWITGFISGELTQTINAINQDVIGLHRWIDGYELPLIRGIGNDLAGLRDWVGRNAATHAEVSQAGAATLAQARALVVPIEAAISNIDNSPCMKVCEPLGNLGQLIQGLEDAGLLAIMLALIAETEHDPVAVQTALRNVLQPAVHDIVSSIGLGQ